jgi:putative superfamily III holin-X
MGAVRNGGAVSELSYRQLISEIRAKASLLAKTELELTKAEFRADVQAELATVKAFGIAALALLFGLNVLLVAGVLALATRIPGWAAALIIGGLWLVIGAVAAYVGWRRMVTNPLALTRQTLKEGAQWVKRHLAQE